MSTVIRPEISKKNKYWISKHRYYELKHFCLQYPEWKREYKLWSSSLDATASRIDGMPRNSNVPDPVPKMAMKLSYYKDRMELVEDIARSACGMYADYILKAVTEGYSYEYLLGNMGIPCSRDYYYELYRKFFYELSLVR